MPVDTLLAKIDAEIARLQKAKALLRGVGIHKTSSFSKDAEVMPVATKPAKKRRLSKEARARIAEAQRKRWAAQRANAKQAKG